MFVPFLACAALLGGSVSAYSDNSTAAPPTGIPTTGMPTTAIPDVTDSTGEPTTGEPTTGIPPTAEPVQPTVQPSTGEPSTGQPTTGLPGVPFATGIPSTGMPTTGVPKTFSPQSPPPRTPLPGYLVEATLAPPTRAPPNMAPPGEGDSSDWVAIVLIASIGGVFLVILLVYCVCCQGSRRKECPNVVELPQSTLDVIDEHEDQLRTYYFRLPKYEQEREADPQYRQGGKLGVSTIHPPSEPAWTKQGNDHVMTL